MSRDVTVHHPEKAEGRRKMIKEKEKRKVKGETAAIMLRQRETRGIHTHHESNCSNLTRSPTLRAS
jgi:hypothetical protein